MALDHALATELREREAVLRLYGWGRPTVSFGRNEPADGRYDREAGMARGVDFVRRPTGGRAVLHDAEVTYAVIAPASAIGGPRAAYRAINRALASALGALGAPVDLSTAAGVRPLDAGPCFQSPAEGEVTAKGRKLVGSAQARLDGALLQHGSILVAGDQALLDDLLPDDSGTAPPGPLGTEAGTGGDAVKGRSPHLPPATLRAFLPGIDFDDVRDAVVRHMQKTFDGTWYSDEYRRSELETAARLERERYRNEAWTWRR